MSIEMHRGSLPSGEAGRSAGGAPTAQARSRATGRAFGKAIRGEHADVDGLLYESRSTGERAYAVLDRGLGKLLGRRLRAPLG